MSKRKPKFSRTALDTIAQIVNGQLHNYGRVESTPITSKRPGCNAIEFDGWENGDGEPVLVIFLRYTKTPEAWDAESEVWR